MISVFNITKVAAETVFIQFFIGIPVPQTSSIRSDFVSQDYFAVSVSTKFQFEVDQADFAFCQEVGKNGIDFEG